MNCLPSHFTRTNCQLANNHEFSALSHGHIDHVGGILPHASHRALTSLPRAHYYLLPHLVEPTRTIASAVAQSHGPNGQFAELQLHPVTAEDTIQVPQAETV